MATQTFGNTTNDASTQTFSGPRMYGSSSNPLNPPSSGTLLNGWGRVSVSATASARSKMLIYSDAAAEPDTLQATSDEVTISNTTEALTQYPFSGIQQIAIVSGTPYWIFIIFEDPGTPNFVISRANTAGLTRFATVTYPTPVTPFVSGGSSNGALDLYAEYTVASNATMTGVGSMTGVSTITF